MGIKGSDEITKIKANLESDKALTKVAKKIQLEKFIFKTENQRIKDTRILADISEAVCGAIFLDSDYDLNLVEQKVIDPFYDELDILIQNSIISRKNVLLEILQERFKTSVIIKLEYEKYGEEHDPIWIARNPKILEKTKQIELMKIPKKLHSSKFRNKKDAEKDIYAKIIKYLEQKE